MKLLLILCLEFSFSRRIHLLRAASTSKLEIQEADIISVPPLSLDPKTSWLETGCFLEGKQLVEKRNFLHVYKRSSLCMSSSIVWSLSVMFSGPKSLPYLFFKSSSRTWTSFISITSHTPILPIHTDFSLLNVLTFIIYV